MDAGFDVLALKQHLLKIHAVPRFRQKLLLHGVSLQEDVLLDSPMDLQPPGRFRV